jgi:hypothetical protein
MWGKLRDIQILQHGPRVDGHELKRVSVSIFLLFRTERVSYSTHDSGCFRVKALVRGGWILRALCRWRFNSATVARLANYKAGGARLNKFHVNLKEF